MLRLIPTVTYRGDWRRKLAKFGDVLKAALGAAIVHWHRTMLRHHFQPFGYVRHRYPGLFTARTARYERAKQRRYGHVRVLEWSGTTRAAVTRAIRVSGSAKQMRGVMGGANRALNFVTAQRDMRVELVGVNPQEVAELARRIEWAVAAHLNAEEPVTKVAV